MRFNKASRSDLIFVSALHSNILTFMQEILSNLFKSANSSDGLMNLAMHRLRMGLKKEIIIVCSPSDTNFSTRKLG